MVIKSINLRVVQHKGGGVVLSSCEDSRSCLGSICQTEAHAGVGNQVRYFVWALRYLDALRSSTLWEGPHPVIDLVSPGA